MKSKEKCIISYGAKVRRFKDNNYTLNIPRPFVSNKLLDYKSWYACSVMKDGRTSKSFENMVRLVTTHPRRSYAIRIPPDILQELGLVEGDNVTIVFHKIVAKD